MTRKWERALLAAAVVTVVLGCLGLSQFVLGGIPHGGDAVAYVYQAKIFASGRASAPETPFPDCFWADNVVSEGGRRFSLFPPGWPLLLAPFVALGIAWAAGPFFAGLASFLVFVLARRLLGVGGAWLALVLTILSPFFTFMGASDFAHAACAAASLGMTVALSKALEREDRRAVTRWGAVAGAAAGIAFLIRPLSALLCGIGAVWLLGWTVSSSPRRWGRLAVAALPPLAAAAVVFMIYNWRTTGSPFLLAYQLPAVGVGFLGQLGVLRRSVWENVAVNAPLYLGALNRETWGWPLRDLWPMASLFVVRPRDRKTWGLIGAFLIYLVGESCYYYFDLAFGPRLAFEALPWVVIATAFGLTSIIEAVRSRARRVPLHGVAVLLLVVQAIAGAATLYPRLARYYAATYCGHGLELARAVEARAIRSAIVFLDPGPGHEFAYGSVFLRNALDVGRGDVIFARFVPERVGPVVAAYPGREPWLLRASYEALPGRNFYPDRFRLTHLELEPIGDLVK